MVKKEKNVFKFRSFQERLSTIKIDVTRLVQKTSETPEELDTFLSQGLAKWLELNCSEDFQAFYRQVTPLSRSLVQLVHHQKDIVEKFKTHLQTPDSLAVTPVLELLVEFARDLQFEFYPYFRECFDTLVNLLKTQDTEILENTFKCMAYLFKFLWRYLARDIREVFG